MQAYPREKVSRNEEIFRLYDEGKTLVEIAKIMDLSKQRVHQIVDRRGRERFGPHSWSQEDIDLAFALNRIGVRHREISEVMNRSLKSVSDQLKYRGTTSSKASVRRSKEIQRLHEKGASKEEIARMVYTIDLS